MERVSLSNGVKMPSIVMSTNWMGYKEMKAVVSEGLRCGYRAFDTARDYLNEDIVGKVIQECLREQGIGREEIFITTKIGNSQQVAGNISEQIDISLRNLRTDYVDLWLMHWPYPDHYIETYRKMEKVYESGKVHAIGMANFHRRHFDALFAQGVDVMPHCVQIECHPLRTVENLKGFCDEKKIVVQAYSPLCRMIDPVRDSDVLKEIADVTGKTVGQVILRWHYQRGTVPVFKSVKPGRIRENCDIFDFELTDGQMALISGMNQNYKYHLESASCPGF